MFGNSDAEDRDLVRHEGAKKKPNLSGKMLRTVIVKLYYRIKNPERYFIKSFQVFLTKVQELLRDAWQSMRIN